MRIIKSYYTTFKKMQQRVNFSHFLQINEYALFRRWTCAVRLFSLWL